MTVIPIGRPHQPNREPNREPSREPSRVPKSREPCRSTPIRGAFQCPRGLTGMMQGTLRIEHFSMGPHGAAVEGVFTGELFDGAGAHIGRGSRRQSATVHLTGPTPAPSPRSHERSSTTSAIIEPVTVDLMGFEVSIPPITIPARCAMGRCSHQDNPEIEER